MKCNECKTELRPTCNLKKEGSDIYCARCHWLLFGKERYYKLEKEKNVTHA